MKAQILVIAALGCTLALQSCSSNTVQEKVATEDQQSTYTVIDGYRFKLSPDVQPDGIAHLDFYVRNAEDKHLKGATGFFIINKPDGTKVTIPMAEEEPNDHYHGMVKLDLAGEYLIVAQVTIDGKKFNPRFNFTRKL